MSKLNLQRLHQINQKRKNTVFGYIRTDKSSKDKEIPDEIILICVLFFGNDIDSFNPDLKTNGMTLSKDNRRVQYKRSSGNIYGKRIVDSGYHEWKFKIIKTGKQGGCFVIGVWRCTKEDPPLQTFFTSGKEAGYGIDPVAATKTNITNGCTTDSYGMVTKHGDIVEMILDFDKLSLSFSINGKSMGKSHDIKKDKYRVAIYMAIERKTVEIIG